MNYLAHLALSYHNQQYLVGNFLADLSTRQEVETLSVEVKKGVTMHQHIDGFTDRHELVLKAKSLMPKRSRRYAGILLDLYFDHLLIVYWDEFYEHSLENFISFSYDVLQRHEHFFPKKALVFSQRVRSVDLLGTYKNITGIKQALCGVDKRLKRPVGLNHLLDDVLVHKEIIDPLFVCFYKELKAFVESQFR